jgi:hypothetical protein
VIGVEHPTSKFLGLRASFEIVLLVEALEYKIESIQSLDPMVDIAAGKGP